MNSFSSSTRNQHPHHGLDPGKKEEKRRKKKRKAATSTSSSSQVSTPPSSHPPHHIYGPSGPPSLPPFGSNTQSTFDKDTLSDTSNTSYTSFDSTCLSEGSADAARGTQAGPVYGPDRWSSGRGQASGGNVDLLAPDPEVSDDGMEVSVEATNVLLTYTQDEETEITLSEVSGLSSSKAATKADTPATSSAPVPGEWPISSTPSPVPFGPVRGISPAVSQARSVRPPSLRAYPRPRFPVCYPSNFKHPSPIIFRHGRPIYVKDLPAMSPRASAPRPVIPFRYSARPQVPDTRPEFILPPPPPMPVLPSAAPRSSTPSVRQPPAATVTSGELSMSDLSPQALSPFRPPAALRSSTPILASQPPAAPTTPGSVSMSDVSPLVSVFPSHDFTRPPPSLGSVQRPPPPSFNPMEGRTVRVEPTSNIGPFAPAVEYTPALNSFAISSNLARIPVLNHHKQVVPSKRPKQPHLSPDHKLNLYISSHPVHGLQKNIEQVYKEDLSLELLKCMLSMTWTTLPPVAK